MISYVFPGQGAQFCGMGKDMYESSDLAKSYFNQANEILGFDIAQIMFEGSEEDLKQTKVTQPALYLHALIRFKMQEGLQPDAVAGHSLGEFTALAAAGALSFEDGLKLVSKRAMAMQKACDMEPGTMAAILGMEDQAVEDICSNIDEIVVAANYNCPGQLVISGSMAGVEKAVAKAQEAGARRALLLPVGGAFHSPLMTPAQEELSEAISQTEMSKPICPIYQNVSAAPTQDPEVIKINLNAQLTGPVKWTQIMQNMIADGMVKQVEVGGNGKVLTGLIRKVDRKFETAAI